MQEKLNFLNENNFVLLQNGKDFNKYFYIFHTHIFTFCFFLLQKDFYIDSQAH